MIAYQHLIEKFNQLPISIQIVWLSSIVLFLIIGILIIYLKILRTQLRKKESNFLKYKTKYETLLVNYLYSGNDQELISNEQQLIIDELKRSIHDDFKRKIIVLILKDLMNEISGEMAESIKTLYIKTGLIDYALLKLNSNSWFLIAKYIRELSQFQIKDVNEAVVKHINHPKKEVRKEVQLYLVNLFQFEGLSFLNDMEDILSEWDQIQLLEILQKFDNQQTYNIIPWLESKNDSIVLFALKLTENYNHFEAKENLIKLLSHKNKDIRIRTIKVLTHFNMTDAKELIKSNFNNLTSEEQVAFFNMLEELLEPSDETFIEQHLSHKIFSIRHKAIRNLKTLNIPKFNSFKKLAIESSDFEIYNYVENN